MSPLLKSHHAAPILILAGLAWLALIASGCSTVRARNPVPPAFQDEV